MDKFSFINFLIALIISLVLISIPISIMHEVDKGQLILNIKNKVSREEKLESLVKRLSEALEVRIAPGGPLDDEPDYTVNKWSDCECQRLIDEAKVILK